MMNIPITLVGGPLCGTNFSDCPEYAIAITVKGQLYRRSDRKDPDKRQVFLLHLNGLLTDIPEPCDLA